MKRLLFDVILLTPLFAGCAAPETNGALEPGVVQGGDSARGIDSELSRIDQLLDEWHRAAANADGEAYFRAFAPDGVFLGTDATERWGVEAFRAYAEPYFSVGRGWTYEPFDRHVAFSVSRAVAWFDERLRNEKYGELRGTGTLVLLDGSWRIAHYNMSFPIPNALTGEVVERIRALKAD